MAKVYWIQLKFLLKGLNRYIAKYSDQLQGNLTSEQWACVLAVLNAISECLGALPDETPGA